MSKLEEGRGVGYVCVDACMLGATRIHTHTPSRTLGDITVQAHIDFDMDARARAKQSTRARYAAQDDDDDDDGDDGL